jgi:hypothetical protein
MRKLPKFDPKVGDDLPLGLAPARKAKAKIRVRNVGPNALEHNIQVGTAGFLEIALAGNPDIVWFAVPNGGIRPGVTVERNGVTKTFSKEGRKLKQEGVKSGVADLVFLWKGRMICIEMKNKKGYQFKEQKEFEQAVILAGGVYTVCRSVKEVEDFLDTLGIPLKATVI